MDNIKKELDESMLPEASHSELSEKKELDESVLSEASHSELLEKYTKIVTETKALEASLMREEEMIKELSIEASLAEKRHTQLEERKRKSKETVQNYERALITVIEEMDSIINRDGCGNQE